MTDIGPYTQDILTRIVNVNWGGLFAAGRDTNAERDVDLVTMWSSSDLDWQEATSFSDSGHQYNTRAGAYGDPGAPTFCLGGVDTDFSVPGTFTWRSFIVTSTDNAQTWTKTYFTAHGFVMAMAYDKAKQKFYAQATANTQGDRHNFLTSYDVETLESADGISWSTVLSVSFPGSTPYASPLVVAACDETYQDGTGHNCPGGVYGYNENSRTMIAPYPDINPWRFENRQPGDQIQVRTEDELGNKTTIIKSIPGLGSVFSVTFAGGIWQASGNDNADSPSAIIASSTDDGETWKIVYENAASTVVIVLGTT